jgi:hypothetical protein
MPLPQRFTPCYSVSSVWSMILIHCPRSCSSNELIAWIGAPVSSPDGKHAAYLEGIVDDNFWLLETKVHPVTLCDPCVEDFS